ncbi:MAG TPA: hypothetical protein PLI19_01175 [Erysipelotrichaceae bacterium]|nr:hypothetical protein [Erysipelotrichaceae bacterium]
MIIVEPTKNLTGVTVQGDYYDFSELAESIYRMTLIKESLEDYHYGLKSRLQATYFDMRLISNTDRKVILKENKLAKKELEALNLAASAKNVYYSVNILFPEAIFFAAAVPRLYLNASLSYGLAGKRRMEYDFSPAFKYADYLKDEANLNLLCAGIWQALGKVIGDEELQELIRLRTRVRETYFNYVTNYIDKLNLELIKTDVSKRNEKIKDIAKRIIEKSKDYLKLEEDYRSEAEKRGKSIYDLYNPDFQGPKESEW